MKKKKHKHRAGESKATRKISVSSLKIGFKYVYLAAFFALLSGFFHPLITGTSFDGVIIGSLVLAAGLAGGILLYRAATLDSYRIIYMGIGFGLVAISLYVIFILTGRVV